MNRGQEVRLFTVNACLPVFRTSCLLYYPCLCLCLGFSQIIAILPFLLIHLHLSHIGFTDDLTFIFLSLLFCVRNYFSLNVILPRLKSYGVISTFNLSPGKILMKFFLILPEMWAKISWSFSSLTRNIALGIASKMVPSNSITSFDIYSFQIRLFSIHLFRRYHNHTWKIFNCKGFEHVLQ